MIAKIKEFFKKNEADIILVTGIILIALISFGSGWIMGKKQFYNKTKAEIDNNNNQLKIEDLNFKKNEKETLNDATDQKTINAENKKENENLENIQEEKNKYSAGQITSSYNYNNSKKTISKNNCQYVGSKNSNVYHLPDCPGAKRIKEENKRCFNSKEEAEKAGYRPAKNCPDLQ